jgi:AraC family transcriptional regulator
VGDGRGGEAYSVVGARRGSLSTLRDGCPALEYDRRMYTFAGSAPRPLRLATWHAGEGDHARITPLYRSPLVSFGTFWCAPDDVRWSQENFVGEVAHIVFPATPVWIAPPGREPALTGPNHAVFFNSGDVFRRRRFGGQGDRNHFMVVTDEQLEEWLHEPRFPQLVGKLLPRPYLTVRRVARELADGADALAVEERLLAVGYATVRGAFGLVGDIAAGRLRRTAPVVEQTKALLSARFAERLTLDELGREVNLSPFHLARAFRRHTGYTLHEYRTHLRLRAVVERLEHGDEDLAAIAREVGFSSHSHLTSTFRRAFGLPPSAVRARPA